MIPVVIRGTTQRNRRESAVSEPVKLPRQPWREVSRKAREPSQTTFSPRWGSFTNSNGQVHGSWARYHRPRGHFSITCNFCTPRPIVSRNFLKSPEREGEKEGDSHNRRFVLEYLMDGGGKRVVGMDPWNETVYFYVIFYFC